MILRPVAVGTMTILSLGAFQPLTGAQESASYRLDEHAFNSGGAPGSSGVMTSASFRLKPGSIGDGVAASGLSSASFRGDAGFSVAYPPPGEVAGLVVDADRATLRWGAERSAGHYHVYRDEIVALSGLGYGICLASDVAGTSYTDGDVPAAGTGFFYLVTAANRLHEEGTKGPDSSGTSRANAAPCP